ncbi:hypothetical protein ACVOMV_21210 [Mesorhizobium atlanticum]
MSADSASPTAAGRTVKDIKLSAKGKADVANPTADVSLTGNVEGQPLDIEASLVTADGKRSIKGLSLGCSATTEVSGDLALDDKFLPLGTLTLAVPDIGLLAALANQVRNRRHQRHDRLRQGGRGADRHHQRGQRLDRARRTGRKGHHRQRADRKLSQGAGDLGHDQGRQCDLGQHGNQRHRYRSEARR